MVGIQKVGTDPGIIPTPPEPPSRDTNPRNYIPRGMSPKDRRNLREAGLEWAGTLGGFKVSYGAVAVRSARAVTVTYRMHVWDRYNWDTGKETAVPGNLLSYLLDDDEMDDIAGMVAPPFYAKMDYFTRSEDADGNITYTANDALMGALVESGDADNFDIVGTGSIRTKQFELPRATPTPSPHPPSSAPQATPTSDAPRQG